MAKATKAIDLGALLKELEKLAPAIGALVLELVTFLKNAPAPEALHASLKKGCCPCELRDHLCYHVEKQKCAAFEVLRQNLLIEHHLEEYCDAE